MNCNIVHSMRGANEVENRSRWGREKEWSSDERNNAAKKMNVQTNWWNAMKNQNYGNENFAEPLAQRYAEPVNCLTSYSIYQVSAHRWFVSILQKLKFLVQLLHLFWLSLALPLPLSAAVFRFHSLHILCSHTFSFLCYSYSCFDYFNRDSCSVVRVYAFALHIFLRRRRRRRCFCYTFCFVLCVRV